MGTAPIDYGASLASGVEALSGGGAVQLAVNFVRDPGGALKRRPGISAYQTGTDHGAVIGAVAVNQRGGILYVTEDRYIWLYQPDSATRVALSSSATTTQLDGSGRPIFASTSAGVVIAGGGVMQKVFDFGAVSTRLAGDYAPATTHVCEIGLRLVAPLTDESGNYRWSGAANGTPGVGNYETWVDASRDNAEGRPDPLVGAYENTRELWLFGKTSMQLQGIGSDRLFPFECINVLNVGCGAPYSPINVDDNHAWLDERRRLVMSDGRSFEVLSSGIAKDISALGTVTDCWGFRARQEAYDHLVWVFPTERTAFVYERNSKRWSTWRGFSNGEYAALSFGAYCYWPERNLHLVGSSGGYGMAKLDVTAATDLGEIVSCEAMTGFENHGTPVRKKLTRDLYTLRRGVGTFGGSTQYLETALRDDVGGWREWKQISLGLGGDYEATVQQFNGGVSRNRQRRIRYTGTDDITIVRAEAEFEACDS